MDRIKLETKRTRTYSAGADSIMSGISGISAQDLDHHENEEDDYADGKK